MRIRTKHSNFSFIRSKHVQRYLLTAFITLATVISLVITLNLQLRSTELKLQLSESTEELRLLSHMVLMDAEHIVEEQSGTSSYPRLNSVTASISTWQKTHESVIATQAHHKSSSGQTTSGLIELQRLYTEINKQIETIHDLGISSVDTPEFEQLQTNVNAYMDQVTLINESRNKESGRSFTIIAALSWAAVGTVLLVRFVGFRYIVIPSARKSDENEIKAEIGRLVTSATSPIPHAVWEDIAQQISRLVPSDRFVIGLHNRHANTVRRIFVSGITSDTPTSASHHTFTESIVSLNLKKPTQGLLLNSDELRQLTKTSSEAQTHWDQGLRSLVAGLFIWHGEVIGAISAWSKQSNKCDTYDRDLMLEFANQIVGSVVASDEREVEVTLAEMGRVLSSSRDSEEVFSEFFDLLTRIISYDRAVLADINVEALTATDRFTRDTEQRGEPTGKIYHNNKLANAMVNVFTNDDARGFIYTESDLEEIINISELERGRWEQGFRSLVAVPLI
ncbi:MAG: hypothetical protein HQ477_13210 [Chloroflexi bacterium]|nr:hypothetical protein [Chloroflexota bacterium]